MDDRSETGGRQQPGVQPDPATATYPGMPRWVKVAGLVVLVLVLLVVATTALGLHTPGGPGGHGL
jgi:hypothetical protein